MNTSHSKLAALKLILAVAIRPVLVFSGAAMLVIVGAMGHSMFRAWAEMQSSKDMHHFAPYTYTAAFVAVSSLEADRTPASAVQAVHQLEQIMWTTKSQKLYPNSEPVQTLLKEMDAIDLNTLIGTSPVENCAPDSAVECWHMALLKDGSAPDQAVVEKMAAAMKSRNLREKLWQAITDVQTHNWSVMPGSRRMEREHPVLTAMDLFSYEVAFNVIKARDKKEIN